MTRFASPDSDPSGIDPESLDLIEEYLAGADAAASTLIKRRAHLIELAAWLIHPDTAHPRGEGACGIEHASPGEVAATASRLSG